MVDFIVQRLQVGQLDTNCYIIKKKNARDALVIDPGGDPIVIKDALHRMDAVCRGILLTHGHFDHILALDELRSHRAPVAIHALDAHYLTERDMFSAMIPYDPRPFEPAEMMLDREGLYSLGGFEFYVYHTPGHTPGSVCYAFLDVLFTGDTLFRDSIGTIDFGGNAAQMDSTLAMLYALPGDYKVCPGHEGETTLSDERAHNPFLQKYRKI